MPLAVDSTSIPDPHSARTPHEFVRQMNELRLWAGNPSLRMLRRLAGTTISASGDTVDALPESTTSYLLNGRGLPRPPRLEFVEAFVGACLSARHHPSDEVARELERWRGAWRSLAAAALSANAEGANAEGANAESPPETVAAGEEAAAPAGPAMPKSPRRRRTLVVIASALLLAAATAMGLPASDQLATGTSQRAGAVKAEPAPHEVHRATIPVLRDTDGIDLDHGLLTSQNTAGIDVTPWGEGNHLVTKSGATMALLDQPGAESYQRCAAVPAKRLVTSVRGLYAVPAGRNLCVWTREGRVAMLTLDQTPSPRTGTLALHYVVWWPRTVGSPAAGSPALPPVGWSSTASRRAPRSACGCPF